MTFTIIEQLLPIWAPQAHASMDETFDIDNLDSAVAMVRQGVPKARAEKIMTGFKKL